MLTACCLPTGCAPGCVVRKYPLGEVDVDGHGDLAPAQSLSLPRDSAWVLVAEFAGTLVADEIEVGQNVGVEIVLDGQSSLFSAAAAPMVTLTSGTRKCISVRQLLYVDDRGGGCDPAVTHTLQVRLLQESDTRLLVTLRGMLTVTAARHSGPCAPPCAAKPA